VALVASSVTLSLAIEFLQVLLPGRTPALSDVAAQTAGTVAGMGAWLLVSRDILRWAERRRSDRGHDGLRLGLILFAAGRAIAMMLPLDVTLDQSACSRAGGSAAAPRSTGGSLSWRRR
jgi:hypothetical protein